MRLPMSEAALNIDEVVQALSALPAFERLGNTIRQWALSAAASRKVAPPPTIEAPREEAETPYGNVVDALASASPGRGERMLLGAVLALSLRGQLPATAIESARLAGDLVWLAGHTSTDALPALDAALEKDADTLWACLADTVQSPSVTSDMGFGDRLMAAVALRASRSSKAQRLADELATRVAEPALALALAPKAVAPAPPSPVGGLGGELTWAPRGPLATTALALSGLLLVRAAASLIGRVAFALRRPAEVRLSDRGLEVAHRVELLGRVVHDRETVVPINSLASVTREARYARAGLYAGLAALILGTYFGMGLLIDGIRAPGGSPSLLGLGLLLIILGVALDFALSTYLDSTKKTVRLVVVPKRGRPLCIRGLEPARTDALLRQVALAMGAAAPERAS